MHSNIESIHNPLMAAVLCKDRTLTRFSAVQVAPKKETNPLFEKRPKNFGKHSGHSSMGSVAGAAGRVAAGSTSGSMQLVAIGGVRKITISAAGWRAVVVLWVTRGWPLE